MTVASRATAGASLDRRYRPTRKLAGADIASKTSTATFTGSAFATEDAYQLDAQVNVTAISGSGASITVKLQNSMDGTTWTDVPNGAFGAITADGSAQMTFVGLGVKCRWVATIAGTSPSITWNIDHQVRTEF
jgi:hypothetical protein